MAAYAAGEFSSALTELRAAARISGSPDYLPMMADCERGLGRPERALALATSAESGRLDREGKVELLIVAAGARRDLGQADAAVLTLQVPALRARGAAPWLARLRYARSRGRHPASYARNRLRQRHGQPCGDKWRG